MGEQPSVGLVHSHCRVDMKPYLGDETYGAGTHAYRLTHTHTRLTEQLLVLSDEK